MKYNIKDNIDVVAPVVYHHHYGLLEYSIFTLTIAIILIQVVLLVKEIRS